MEQHDAFTAATSDAELSPLDGVLRRHGATIVQRHGRSVTAHFGSTASEVAVCLSTVGIADRSDRTTIELRGAPQDLEAALGALAPLGARTWWVRTTTDSAIVRCEHVHATECSAALPPTEQLRVVDSSTRYAAIGVVGPLAADLLSSAELDTRGSHPIVLHDGASSFELLVDAESGPALWDQLLVAGAQFRVACVGLDALEHLAASQSAGRRAGARTN